MDITAPTRAFVFSFGPHTLKVSQSCSGSQPLNFQHPKQQHTGRGLEIWQTWQVIKCSNHHNCRIRGCCTIYINFWVYRSCNVVYTITNNMKSSCVNAPVKCDFNILMLCGTNLYNFLFIIINSLIITSQILWKTKSLQKVTLCCFACECKSIYWANLKFCFYIIDV